MLSLLFCLQLLLRDCVNAEGEIDWFKQTAIHQQNIAILSEEWEQCADWTESNQSNFTAECIDIRVPLDWDNVSSNRTIDFHIGRVFAYKNDSTSDKNGAFWTLDGGPGLDGSSFYGYAPTFLTYMDRSYDLYIPGHRGTLRSTPIECPSEFKPPPHSDRNISQCVDFMHSKYHEDIHYFSTYAAALDLGYVIDLFTDDFAIYPVNDTIVYSVSYGTYYINVYLNLFPNQANAAILDGVFTGSMANLAGDINNVSMRFMQLCTEDTFCRKQLGDDPFSHLDKIYAKIKNGDVDVLKCVGNATLSELKQALYLILAIGQEYLGLLPAAIFRMNRCNENDQNAIKNLVQFADSKLSGSTNFTNELGDNIILSELWSAPGSNYSDPGLSEEELQALDDTYYLSLGMLGGLRNAWDLWDRYKPHNDVWRKYADPKIPVLLLNGDLDPQTPHFRAVEVAVAYGADIDNKGESMNDRNLYFYTIPTAPHDLWIKSKMVNESDITCGLWIMKSFIYGGKNKGEWKPNTDCTEWILPIDFEGSTNGSKFAASLLFGTDDVWEISTPVSSPKNKTVIWIVIILLVVLVLVLTIICYRRRAHLRIKAEKANTEYVTL